MCMRLVCTVFFRFCWPRFEEKFDCIAIEVLFTAVLPSISDSKSPGPAVAQVARCEASLQQRGEVLGGRWQLAAQLGLAQPFGETTILPLEEWGEDFLWKGGHICGLYIQKPMFGSIAYQWYIRLCLEQWTVLLQELVLQAKNHLDFAKTLGNPL